MIGGDAGIGVTDAWGKGSLEGRMHVHHGSAWLIKTRTLKVAFLDYNSQNLQPAWVMLTLAGGLSKF